MSTSNSAGRLILLIFWMLLAGGMLFVLGIRFGPVPPLGILLDPVDGLYYTARHAVRSGSDTLELCAREHLDTADRHLVRRQLNPAVAHYQQALDHCREGQLDVRIDALYGLASVYRVREVTGTAIGYYNKVLELEPTHSPALHSLIHMYASLDQWDDVEKCELRLLSSIKDAHLLIDELVASGDRWWRGAGQPGRAEIRYQQAHNLDESNEAARRRLQELAEIEQREQAAQSSGAMAMAPTPAVCSLLPIQLQLDERIVGQLDEVAEQQGKSRNTVMMLALLHYIESQREPPVSME